MPDQPLPIVYDDDTRYPGPLVHPPPDYIKGIPTQGELDAQARMFTWGELKEIIKSGDLELLMRNKKMQARYDTWMIGIKGQYGSTEAYLTQARLPWANPQSHQGHTTDQGPISPMYDLHLDPLPARSHTPTSPHLEPPIPTSPTSYPYPPPPMSPTGEPSPNLADPNGGLKVDVSDSQLLGPRRHGRTPSITVSPSEAAAPRILLAQGDETEVGKEVNLNLPKKASPDVVASGNSSMKASPKIIPEIGSPGSGTSTPSSVGFVSLSSLNLVNGKLKKSRSRTSTLNNSTSHLDLDAIRTGSEQGEVKGNGNGGVDEDQGEEGDEEGEKPDYLRWEGWLDGEKYAVLPNDWPYNVPTGVRHYCVWSRIPIAHPDLVNYSPEAWSKIESEGLGGFTGVTPLFRRRAYPTYTPLSASPSPPDSGINTPSPLASATAGRTKNLGHLEQDEWYAVDCDYSGNEKRKWAGVGYECQGGGEVGRMVRGLWDERGWECLWFVNPPRLQSVPGFSHFHVFARRKTPEEIDASEAAMKASEKRGLRKGGESDVPSIA